MQYKWPLNVSQFSFLDKLKICRFILTDDHWTHGKYIAEYERLMSEYIGCKYCVFVSSGSTANTLLAMYLKDNNDNPEKNIIVFPSTTWATSVSPFLREGFTPHFIDIKLTDFSLNLDELENYLVENSYKVRCVFVTSLIGFCPNVDRLKDIEKKYSVRIMMDNCENTLGNYDGKNISSFFTSTTSTYFGHQLQTVEGGFIFTNNEREYDYFLMARNHGMVRSLPEAKRKNLLNPSVDKQFDFNILGNNFRNTDISAFMGLLDFERINFYKSQRISHYKRFKDIMETMDFIFPPEQLNIEHVPFCLPIIHRNKNLINKIKNFCDSSKIEKRPIISGNLLRQTCFKKYDNFSDFEKSEFLNENGFYIGLYPQIKINQIVDLCLKIAKII